MSDEMNTNNGEETAALFVSSQKKKQAEEEARKKAEAEQAKRDAAEAEVRRMEAEVEERKRKAEEEKRALEEAAKQAEAEKTNVAEKIKASVDVEEIKSKVKEKTQGKPKLPLIIGAGVAAVAIIVLIIVLVVKGKKPAIDFETLEFAKEYTFTDENNGTVTIKYPESLYTDITGEKLEGCTALSSLVAVKKAPEMNIIITEPVFKKGEAGLASAKTAQSIIDESVKQQLTSVKVSDEKTSDIASDTPGKYFYDCTFTSEDGKSGALTTWLEPNSNGEYVAVMAIFSQEGADAANSVRLRDVFEETNSDDALKIPGATPPASADTDGTLEIDAMHMGIIVPKGRFNQVVSEDGMYWWTDDNGASICVLYKEAEFDFSQAEENLDQVQPMLKDLAETGAGLKYAPDLESRMFLKDSWLQNLIYHTEYKDILGGITYWESNHASMWRDVRTNKHYIYDLVFLAPNSNEDIYRQMFDKAVDRLQDI